MKYKNYIKCDDCGKVIEDEAYYKVTYTFVDSASINDVKRIRIKQYHPGCSIDAIELYELYPVNMVCNVKIEIVNNVIE